METYWNSFTNRYGRKLDNIDRTAMLEAFYWYSKDNLKKSNEIIKRELEKAENLALGMVLKDKRIEAFTKLILVEIEFFNASNPDFTITTDEVLKFIKYYR